MLKADLHIHTKYSMDSRNRLETIISRCQELGINCIAIADHGTAAGALRMKEIAPFAVIVAEEILTPHGEIMGMFLKQTIPSNISVEQAIAEIRAQDGLVCIPHLFDPVRGSTLDSKIVEQILGEIDIVEAFNARSPLTSISTRARAFAERHGIPKSAGSDAHTEHEIGNAYIEMPEFNGKDEFLKALARGKISGHKSSPLVHVATTLTKLKLRLRKPSGKK